MIVPSYWAESRLQHKTRRAQVTVRRFGWSDTSEAEARQMADARVREAYDRILAGERLRRRELKAPYNGAEGLPIREEVVSRQGETVISRNLYGALCLNTPDVLFADIDFATDVPGRLVAGVVLGLLLLALVLGITQHSRALGFGIPLLTTFFGYGAAVGIYRLWLAARGGVEAIALRRVRRFLSAHPDWGLRLYRTPAGFRLLAMHRTFDPGEPAVTECFRALGTDPVYVRMCQLQRCFRARCTPKPWRIGIAAHLRPRPGVWPITAERLPERRAWIERYERASAGYASCRFVEAAGSAIIHPSARAVQELHDRLCHAGSSYPLA